MQSLLNPELSIVIPVYLNEGSIPDLIARISGLTASVSGGLEAVFVVDGSPDSSYARLYEQLPHAGFSSQLVSLTRNFGAFSAVRVGLSKARGHRIVVMAADLQEPPELAIEMNRVLASGQVDVAMGVRASREDPYFSKVSSALFWSIYRRLVIRDIPRGGVDIFGVTAFFRDRLLLLGESNTSLLGQLFWLGGRRQYIAYHRRARMHGKSAWTLKKKLRYLSDSIFAFTDLPVRALFALGIVALISATLLAVVVVAARLSGMLDAPGYAGTMVTILFFGALNSLGLGVVGSYAWRAFENTKARPLAIVQSEMLFPGDNRVCPS